MGFCRAVKKQVSNTGSSKAANDTSNYDAQVSKGLMAVFMKATLAEQTMIDLILTADELCNSSDSEDKQLTDIFSFLEMSYDAQQAAENGGASCFSGPEGVTFLPVYGVTGCQCCDTAPAFSTHLHPKHVASTPLKKLVVTQRCAGHKKLSVMGLMATDIFRTSVQKSAAVSFVAGGTPQKQRVIRNGASLKRNSQANSAAAAAAAAAAMGDSDSDEGEPLDFLKACLTMVTPRNSFRAVTGSVLLV